MYRSLWERFTPSYLQIPRSYKLSIYCTQVHRPMLLLIFMTKLIVEIKLKYATCLAVITVER